MGILKKIFNGEKTIEAFSNVFNKISSGIDKSILTKEEMADIWIKLVRAYEPFKLSQRLIMLIVVPSYVFIVFVGLALLVASYWNDGLNEIAISVFEIAEGTLRYIVLIIVSFYFGGGAVEGIVNKVKEKNK